MHFFGMVKKRSEVQFTKAVMQMTKQQCFCGGKLAVNSPVKRRRVTLCLTAENHLPVLLHGVYWKHNAAWLLREHGALQRVAYRQSDRERERAISMLHLQTPNLLAKQAISWWL